MLINEKNYECYVLDYLEGSLSPEYRKEMETFLLAHPALMEELSSWEDFRLPDDQMLSFENKSFLKADLQKGNLPAIEEWLENHSAIKLPLEHCEYPYKKQLKKKTTISFGKPHYYWVAAAGLALLLAALWVWRPSTPENAPSSRFAQELPKEKAETPHDSLPLPSKKVQEEETNKPLRQDKVEPELEYDEKPLPEYERSPSSSIVPLPHLASFSYEAPLPTDLLAPSVSHTKVLSPVPALLAAENFFDQMERAIETQGAERISRLQARILIAYNNAAYTLRRKSIVRRIELEQKLQEIDLRKHVAQNN